MSQSPDDIVARTGSDKNPCRLTLLFEQGDGLLVEGYEGFPAEPFPLEGNEAVREVAALTEKIIGLGIKVHRALGAGLLETVYNQCLCWELHHNGLAYEREVPFPVVYQGVRLDKGFLAGIVIENSVLLEIKSVERILPVHESQTGTYMKLSGCRLALLMNFNTPMLKDGLRRFIN